MARVLFSLVHIILCYVETAEYCGSGQEMIKSVSIANIATFGSSPEELTELSQFNYVFGSNGTGKTTISRVIADQDIHPDCSVSWKDGRSLETAVLNLDFVEKNFDQLKGVFTLGEKQKDTLERIVTAKQELDKERTSQAGLKNTLEGQDGTGGKKGELAQLETDLLEKCWVQKQKHDEKLQGAFTGYRNNTQKFKAKVLEQLQTNRAPLKPLSNLEKRAESIFGETPTKEDPIPMPDMASFLSHESNPILTKRVIGKDDVDIAAMIKRLGNSDWLRQGLTFYKANDQV